MARGTEHISNASINGSAAATRFVLNSSGIEVMGFYFMC